MNKDTTFSIFLSYSWKDMKTADSIDNDFTQTGVKILRDVRDLGYKDSIRDFMRKINDTDYVILLISRAYLESPNCMYEVLELLKDPNYKKRILPIILEDANIFNSKGKIELIKFWENKTSELNAHTGSLDRITNVSSIIKDIEHFEKIRNSIDEFISVIIDLNCKTLKELKDNGYKAMLDLMGISNESIMAEMLFTTSIDDLEERDIAIHKLSTKYPKNINILLLKGMLALNKKQWKLAMTYFSDFIKNHANFPDAHNNLGIAYSNLKEYDKAIIEYETAISIDSKYYEAYTNLGSTYLEDLPDYEKSKKNSEKALELNSENGRAHYNYACLFDDDRDRFDQQKDIEKSIDHYLEAIRTSSS
ncbi:MAG: toll/interleukin-1 receptor domain-containing protein, partial [Bacteroidia bacterium]